MTVSLGQRLFALLASLGLFYYGCGGPSSQQGGGKAAKTDAEKKKKGGGSQDEEAVSEDGDEVVENADKAFGLFCERAAETKAVQDKLGSYLEKLCNGGKPTKTFTSALIKSAYDGSNEPSLKKMGEWEEDKANKTTAGFFGVGIKIPISIEDHFNKVGPNGGNKDVIKSVIESTPGTTVDLVEIKQTHEKDDKYQIRGWTVEQKTTRVLEKLKIKATTHTISRSDQFELEKGSVYLYTSYITESIETIKNFETLTAGVKIGDDSYLLTISYVKIDNKGVHAAAQTTIKDTAGDVVRQMYDQAKKVQ